MTKRIFLSPPHMGGSEQKYIQDAFDINYIAPLGPNVDGFEKAINDYTGCGNCVVLSSGTAAIHLALMLLGVKQDDEVIVSSFTFSASVNPIIYLKAIPVFVDSEPDTWNMDPELLETAIKDRISKGNKPKAVILVHLYGMPAKIDEIKRICDLYEIPLIEDAAEALGSKFKGKALGTFGQVGLYSFNGNKIITTSGGGALVSSNADVIKKAKFLATQARDNAPHYQHSEIGYNYRMSNVLAGIGRGQMEVLDRWVKKRRQNKSFYKELFRNTNGIKFLDEPDNRFFSNFWLTTLTIDSEKTGFSHHDLASEMDKHNIETRPLWKPMHLQPVFCNYPSYLNGVSEYLFNHGICLPSGSNMDSDDKVRIKESIQILTK
ncbi:aminotransferase class I/II-fold pyridoxal phosphate-dependent enzyme [Saccharicrinis sp. FJH62]|uniref:aminotransferase class I/II-fold pyridoxal phosphate-dependent enzyme n=1 Tax=Saccharicrinis sp. FJH62 TaxID=3344657 RepID=UPI0035D50759